MNEFFLTVRNRWWRASRREVPRRRVRWCGGRHAPSVVNACRRARVTPVAGVLPTPDWTAERPSREIDPARLAAAACVEATAFSDCFGAPPDRAVATTFVWNDSVEAARASAGLRGIVTPGQRAAGRNASGAPGPVDKAMLTGEHGCGGVRYRVRDVYFEPALGHAPERLVAGLVARTRQGRACWVETHRCNFLDALDASLATLDLALTAALQHQPALRFASPGEILGAIRGRDRAWIETRFRPRWRALRARADDLPRFRRLARLSGLGWIL